MNKSPSTEKKLALKIRRLKSTRLNTNIKAGSDKTLSSSSTGSVVY